MPPRPGDRRNRTLARSPEVSVQMHVAHLGKAVRTRNRCRPAVE